MKEEEEMSLGWMVYLNGSLWYLQNPLLIGLKRQNGQGMQPSPTFLKTIPFYQMNPIVIYFQNYRWLLNFSKNYKRVLQGTKQGLKLSKLPNH